MEGGKTLRSALTETFLGIRLSRQIQPRQHLKKLPLQANFYPMPTMAYIQDARSRLTLHTAQALGVSSLGNGEWWASLAYGWDGVGSLDIQPG